MENFIIIQRLFWGTFYIIMSNEIKQQNILNLLPSENTLRRKVTM